MGGASFNAGSPLIVIRARVMGRSPGLVRSLPLALDTGAWCTVIPCDIAVALGYHPAGSPDRRRIVTGSGIEYASVVRVTEFSAIGETVADLEVLCHDLPEEARVDGVLGMNFLRNFDVHILFWQGVIELRRRA